MAQPHAVILVFDQICEQKLKWEALTGVLRRERFRLAISLRHA